MQPRLAPFDGLGPVLRELRRDRELTRKDLAQRCQLAEGAVAALEEGRDVPSLEVLGRVLDALGADVRELGHRLERARRRATGATEPPEVLREIAREMTEGLWTILWINWRPGSSPAPSEPPAALRARAAEAAEMLAGVLWAGTAGESREATSLGGGGGEGASA